MLCSRLIVSIGHVSDVGLSNDHGRRDGRDRSMDYKISGFHVAPGSPDAEVRCTCKRKFLPSMLPVCAFSHRSAIVAHHVPDI